MNGDCQIIDQGLCGCCTGVMVETPQPITNRPSLPRIAYRVGTHGQFKSSMLTALSDPNCSALAGLRTRDDSDFTIALLDAFAVSADILTFYQERLANEAFLRTAVDQRSVFELARLVGYRPSPGVAASTFIAFSLNTAPGSPDNVLIAAGTRVQSIPGPGQTPAVFETSSDITAQIANNALKAQTTAAWALQGSAQNTWIAGVANNINVGDALLFVSAPSGAPSTTGPADVRYVNAAVKDSASGNTQLFWDQPLSNVSGNAVCIYIFRKKAALFGVQAPNPALLTKVLTPKWNSSKTDWFFEYAGGDVINLDASYPGLSPAAKSPSTAASQLQWLVLTGPKYTSYFQITKASETNPNLYTLSTKTTQLTVSDGHVLAGNPALTGNALLTDFTAETRSTTAYVQSELLTPAAIPLTTWNDNPSLRLAPGMIVPVQSSSVAVVAAPQINVNQPIGIRAQRIRMQVLNNSGVTFTPNGSSQSPQVTTNQVFIVNRYPPTPDATGTPTWSVQSLSGVEGTLLIPNANLQLLPADPKDPFATEAAIVNSVLVNGDITALSLASPLTGIYDAATLTVNANVAPASHGETMHEILGSGDSTNAALQFTLKQSPLTYITSSSAQGTASTLEVWVNNLHWHEVDNFLNSGPNDRVFITRVNGDGSVTVQFGDGINGARTPTGQMNIRAVYRKGIGQVGMVQAGQLAQPLDRPQGLQSSQNPSPASGGADPDTAATAQTSAPLHTLTLDRVVSLEDFQNTALAFGGISKALATWTWFGGIRGVFITVAGSNGSPFKDDDLTLLNLIDNLHSHGNRYVPLKISSYSPVSFTVAANVRINTTDYDSTAVLAAVWAALSAAFAFDQRQLGQGVAQSQILTLIQQIPGVIAVSLTQFYRNDQPQPAIPAVLRAASPLNGQNGITQSAELLLLDPASQALIVEWS
ncbi:MAG TPA: putative baseplate assembly protein [Tepidisphaeraceae bacterium]|jgi:hypothetical protein|nr:putative baseplate assembly protein [Tepidisphaeraceae bacterium]